MIKGSTVKKRWAPKCIWCRWCHVTPFEGSASATFCLIESLRQPFERTYVIERLSRCCQYRSDKQSPRMLRQSNPHPLAHRTIGRCMWDLFHRKKVNASWPVGAPVERIVPEGLDPPGRASIETSSAGELTGSRPDMGRKKLRYHAAPMG